MTRVMLGYLALLVPLWLAAAELFPVFGLDDKAVRVFIFICLCGLPFAIFLSWKYNITAEGIVRDPMDIDDAPLTAESVREWCAKRQGRYAPSTLSAFWTDDKQLPRSKDFKSSILLGRGMENDISIPDKRVSRMHAVIWCQLRNWYVRDLESSNGTYLNGERVEDITILPPKGELQMHEKGPTVRFDIAKDDETLLTLATPKPPE